MALAISWQRPWQEVPPVSSAGALRTVAPHGSIAESRKDGGAQSRGGRYGWNVCVCLRFVCGVLTPCEVGSLGDT